MTIDPYNAFLHLAAQPGTGGPVVGVKDVIDVAGMPTTAASRILDRLPEQDADCVGKLRAAGATIAGKLNTHEFAFGALTNSPHFGPALNPWSTAHSCGGSSGGSGAAVAAGLVDVALGTDTAGSIRIPSAFCGVTGIRPSAGLVSTAGVFPTAPTLDTVGPLARSAAECRQILETLAGRSLDPPARDLRIGVVTSLFEGADPGVAAACEAALRDLPGRLEPVTIPLHEEIGTITQLIMLPEATAVHLPWLRTRLADYGADVRARLLAGLFLPQTAHATGLRARGWVRDQYERALGGYDVLVAPAMPITAPRLDAVPPDYRLLVMPYNSPAALLGLPVVVAPSGFVDGLPVGLALTGRRGEDGVPLALAQALQERTDWHLRSPVDSGPANRLYTRPQQLRSEGEVNH
ncbi:MAG: aspartyl-tRNA(Asn)/glutamyl-tRNA(Gln) amidotransferase subunit [Gaiellaceae bacterium]|nr:aspartyl-tRNA(Asn)/glutamyl-tRNA(Gln) amidotransferase subunit [Gaiellaceae bacterium]